VASYRRRTPPASWRTWKPPAREAVVRGRFRAAYLPLYFPRPIDVYLHSSIIQGWTGVPSSAPCKQHVLPHRTYQNRNPYRRREMHHV
jgi:hypothetical protein